MSLLSVVFLLSDSQTTHASWSPVTTGITIATEQGKLGMKEKDGGFAEQEQNQEDK